MTIVRKIALWLVKFENLVQEMTKSERDMMHAMVDAVFAAYDKEVDTDAV